MQIYAFFIAVALTAVLATIDIIRENRKSTREKIRNLIIYYRSMKNPAPFGYYSPSWLDERDFIEKKISKMFRERHN